MLTATTETFVVFTVTFDVTLAVPPTIYKTVELMLAFATVISRLDVTAVTIPWNIAFDVIVRLADVATVPPLNAVLIASVFAANVPVIDPFPVTVAPVVLLSTVTAYLEIASAT